MLTLESIACRRGHHTALALDRLSLAAGTCLALLGPNGAGKSTLVGVLGGQHPFTGRIHFHGRPLWQWPAAARARHIGILLQSSQPSFAFTAAEVAGLGLTPLRCSRTQGQHLVRTTLRRLGCEQLAQRSYHTLSGGERQRVQLARILVQLSQAEQAPLLILDEPTAAQDLGQQHAVLALAQELARERGYGVIAVLHDLNQALRYCETCCLLSEGRQVACGNTDTVLTPETVASLWGYRPHCLPGPQGMTVLI